MCHNAFCSKARWRAVFNVNRCSMRQGLSHGPACAYKIYGLRCNRTQKRKKSNMNSSYIHFTTQLPKLKRIYIKTVSALSTCNPPSFCLCWSLVYPCTLVVEDVWPAGAAAGAEAAGIEDGEREGGEKYGGGEAAPVPAVRQCRLNTSG